MNEDEGKRDRSLLELAERHTRTLIERLESSLPILGGLGHPALSEVEELIKRALLNAGAIEQLLKDESETP